MDSKPGKSDEKATTAFRAVGFPSRRIQRKWWFSRTVSLLPLVSGALCVIRCMGSGINIGNGLWLPSWRSLALCAVAAWVFETVKYIAGFVIVPATLFSLYDSGSRKPTWFQGRVITLIQRFDQGRLEEQAQQMLKAALYGREKLHAQLKVDPVRLTAVDGTRLDAMHVMPAEGTRETLPGASPSAVLLLNANAQFYELDPLAGRAAERYSSLGFDVLMFNYRGVGRSMGLPSREGLVLDADAALQYLLEGVGVPAERVILVGQSLGGAVATEVALCHPGVALCNCRSFSSLSAAALKLIEGRLGTVAASLVRLIGWDTDCAASWKAVQGFKWVENIKTDEIVRSGSRLYDAIKEIPDLKVVHLQPSTSEDTSSHNRALYASELKERQDLMMEVLKSSERKQK